MNILSILSAVSCSLYFLMGFYIYIINRKSVTNILYAAACLLLSVWSFAAINYHSAQDSSAYLLWYKISGFGFFYFIAVILHFFIRFTGKTPRLPFLILLYIPGTLLYVLKLLNYHIIADLELSGRYWLVTYNLKSPEAVLLLIYMFSYIIACIVLVARWGLKSDSIKSRKQSKIIIISICFSLTATIVDFFILRLLLSIKGVIFFDFIPLIWQAGIMYSIIRYKLLSITPEFISREILSNIDEGVILLDQKNNVSSANDKARELLGTDKVTLDYLRKAVCDPETVIKTVNDLITGGQKTFSYRLSFYNNNGKMVLTDARFSVIRDDFGDFAGTLIIAREVKGLRQLQSVHKLTDRETEIIIQLISGQTNQEVAENLYISLNTTKRHIANIYHKMDIMNKVQLFHLVQDFELMPAKS